MTVKEIIEQLRLFPPETKVCLFDWRMNLANDIGDGCTEGIYDKYEVSMINFEKDEIEFIKERHNIDFEPWVGISFENKDYSEDGEKIE